MGFVFVSRATADGISQDEDLLEGWALSSCGEMCAHRESAGAEAAVSNPPDGRKWPEVPPASGFRGFWPC